MRKYNFVSRISTGGGYFSKGVLVMNDAGFGPDLLNSLKVYLLSYHERYPMCLEVEHPLLR